MKATNIEWDVESHEEAELLPSEIEIPDGMTDMDEISDYISDETGYCHKGYILEDGQQEATANIEAMLSMPPVARIDFLGSDGTVGDSVEYRTEEEFLKAVKEDLYHGVPLVVILYRDGEGKTISCNFLNELDTFPKELRKEDAPVGRPKKLVSSEEAIRIIETRKPSGLFIQQAGDRWVGIDNTTGDAWTEEFEDLNACLSWLG